MSEKTNVTSQIFLEPIICDVRVPIERVIWGQSFQPHQGDGIFNIKQANPLNRLLFASAVFQKIETPYRFTLTSGEIVYEKKRIRTVKLAGFYLSGIDPIKVAAQLSPWNTPLPPETFLDDEDEIIMSEEFSQKCYFVAHRKNEEFHIAWNLAENFDVCQNPQNYSGIQWHIVDLTK